MSLSGNDASSQPDLPPPLPKRWSGSVDIVSDIEPYNTAPQPSATNRAPSIYDHDDNISSSDPPPPLPKRQQSSFQVTPPMRSAKANNDEGSSSTFQQVSATGNNALQDRPRTPQSRISDDAVSQANTAAQSTNNTMTTQPSEEEVSFQFDRNVQEIRRRRTVAKRAPPPDRDDFTKIEAESGKRILHLQPYLQACFMYFVESLARDDKVKKTEPLQWSKMKTLISRLYDTSEPVQSLGFYVERVMYWKRPSETLAWFILYFTLWACKMWLPAIISLFAIKILNNRFGFLGDFKETLDVPAPLSQNVKDKEPIRKNKMNSQLSELIHSKDLTDWISQMTKIWGPYSQAMLEENTRYLERIINLFRWERPEQTWRVLALLSSFILVSAFFQPLAVPAIGLFIGVEFFILLPLQRYYPRFSHLFSPLEWILWGVPTNAELAVEMLTRQEDEKQQSIEDIDANGTAGSVRGEDSASFVTGLSPASKIKYEYQKRVQGGSSSRSSISSDAPPTGSLQEESAEYHCLLRGKPGKLVITEDMLQFRSAKILGREVEAQISWENIDTIKKSKTMNLGFWSMPGINVTDIYGHVIVFQNVVHRDDAFRKLVVTSGKKWNLVA